MSTGEVVLKILDYWHSASGLGVPGSVDSLPVKSAARLPYFPGRALRGVLREAVTLAGEIGLVDPESARRLFGVGAVPGARGEPGTLRISNATLPPAIEKWARGEGEAAAATLFRQLPATAINEETGTAKNETLRNSEVVVPLELVATIESDEEEIEWLEVLEKSVGFIRGYRGALSSPRCSPECVGPENRRASSCFPPIRASVA